MMSRTTGAYVAQSGFTLIETSVSLIVIAFMIGAVTVSIQSKLQDADVRATIATATKIANYAESVRSRSIATTTVPGANGVQIYQQIYPTLPAGSSVAELLLLANSDAGFPNESEFGTPYLVELNAAGARVEVVIPEVITPPGINSVVNGDETTLIFHGRKGLENHSRLTSKAKMDKVLYYEESYR